MKINREKSNRMKKIIALSLATGILIGSGITMYSIARADENSTEYMKKHREYLRTKRMCYENIKNASLDEFDGDLINLYRNGRIVIRNIEYKLADLYIMLGNVNNEKTIYLFDYKNPEVDIFSGKMIDTNFEREKIMLWAYSQKFYHFYLLNQDNDAIVVSENNYHDFEKAVLDFDAVMHEELPETYYLMPSHLKK